MACRKMEMSHAPQAPWRPGSFRQSGTCGGQFDRKSGHIKDNIIVFASEVRA